MCPNKMVWIFVYGTLKKGGRLDYGLASTIKETSVTGATMYMREWNWFPFAKVDGSTNKVIGEVHLYPEHIVEKLDRLEGTAYVRRNVITDCGIPCQMYHFIGDPEDYELEVVESGEFDQHANL